MPCTGLCVPGSASCPTPIECGLPPAAPPAEPPPSSAWLEELHKVRKEMLAYLKTIPVTRDLHWKREATKNHARLVLAHKLLKELRAGATATQMERIDAELARVD